MFINLIVDYDVDGAASSVTWQVTEMHSFVHNSLTTVRRVTVQ